MQPTDTDRSALYRKMDTRAEKATLQHLPAEILSAIIDNLSRNEDITSFRLTCRKVGSFAASKASLYRKVNLCLHPWSRMRFELIAFNKIPGRAGDMVNSSSRVKDLIFEDTRVFYPDMYFDLSTIGVDPREYPEDLSSQRERFEYQLYYNLSGVDTSGAAAKQSNALETIEYDPDPLASSEPASISTDCRKTHMLTQGRGMESSGSQKFRISSRRTHGNPDLGVF